MQNDIWQTQSWASLEWSGQWKLLHHFMQRTYNHVLVSPFYLKDRISVYVVLDVANYDITYDLQINIIAWTSVSICIPAGTVLYSALAFMHTGKSCE